MDTPAEKRRGVKCLITLLSAAEDIILDVAVFYALYKDAPDLQPEGTRKAIDGIELIKDSLAKLHAEIKDD